MGYVTAGQAARMFPLRLAGGSVYDLPAEERNKERAARGGVALRAYLEAMQDDDLEQDDARSVISDVVTDLLHLASEAGVDPDRVLATTQLNLAAEESGE